MKVELSEAIAERLTERAKHLGVAPEALAQAAIADLVTEVPGEFEDALRDVLVRNAELYRRLG